MKKFCALITLFFTTTLLGYTADNPKVDFDNSQAIVDNNTLQLHTIPHLLSDEKITQVKAWIEEMCHQNRTYEDFDKRIGICWDDYWLTRDSQTVDVDPVAKFVTIDGISVEQKPESIFSFPAISSILLNDILPHYFEAVSTHATIPNKIYLQTFVLRSQLESSLKNKPQLVRWHQDPSEYDTVGDYTLVLMLNDPASNETGWEGGELLVKNGLPTDHNPALKVTPQFNQAVLFNNKNNSHMVTSVKNHFNKGTRDIIIINIYLNDPKAQPESNTMKQFLSDAVQMIKNIVSQQSYTVVAIVEAKPGHEEALKDALLDVVEPSRNESTCLEFRLHEDVNNPAQFVLYETWSSKEAHLKQFEKSYIKAFAEKVPPLLAKPYQVIFAEQLAPKDSTQRLLVNQTQYPQIRSKK